MPKIKGIKKTEKIKNLLANLVVLVVTLIFCFILFEIFLRIFMPQNLNYAEFDTELGLGYKLRANFHADYRTLEYEYEVNTNSMGLREDKEYGYVKSEGSKRIVVLGDSLIFGFTLNADKTYSKQLEKILKENGFNIEVINTGVPGYTTYKELMYLKNELYKYDPDIVIVGFCIANDIMANIDDEETTKHVIEVLKTKKPLAEYLNLKIRKFASSNLHSFQFVREILILNPAIKRFFIKIGLISKAAEFSPTYEEYNPFEDKEIKDDVGMNNTLRMLEEINNFCKQKNIELVLVPIPQREQVNPKYFESFWNTYSDIKIDIDRPQKILKEFSKDKEIIYINGLATLREKDSNNSFYWRSDLHMNAAGFKILAELTYERLIKDNLLS